MKKNSPSYSDEVDLIALFKIILDGKIKILIITIISFLLGFGYNSQLPRNYLNSLTIDVSKSIEFIKLNHIRNLLKLDQSDQSDQSDKSNNQNQLYIVKFINELKDNEEFLLSFKNIKKVQEHFSKIKIKDQEKELFKYTKLLEIVPPKKNEKTYIINFKWNDYDEAKKILKDTLNLTSTNLSKAIYLELFHALELQKKLLLNKDRVRLDYLKEQSAIAKELNIADNQINNVNLTQQSNVSLSINIADIAYYLRGYRAINKEIELIENREYQEIAFIQQELDDLIKQNIKWVYYNIQSMEVKLLNGNRLNLVILIVLGLVVGIFYVLIVHAFQSKKTLKKNN